MPSLIYHTNNAKLKESVVAFIEDWHSDAETIKVLTSGSTGTPKTIELRKQHMIASAKMTGEFLGLEKGQSAFLCLSPDTIAGKMMIVRSIVHNLMLVVGDVVSTPLEGVKDRIDFAAMVPMQARNSIIHNRKQYESISKVIIGGASIPPDLWHTISECMNRNYQTFGMTETISHIAMRSISDPSTDYRLLPGITIDAPDSKLLINAPDLGIKNLETNDIIEITGKDTFKWIARADFIINSGGLKINPSEIESILSPIILSPFFSIGLKDEELGQRHVLCVEGKDTKYNKDQFTPALDNRFCPKEIYYFDKFELTKSGKIDKLSTIQFLKDAEREVL